MSPRRQQNLDMVRNRKQPSQSSNGTDSTRSSREVKITTGGIRNDRNKNNSSNISSSGSSTPSKEGKSTKKYISLSSSYVAIGCCALAVAGYFTFLGYFETRVNTQFDEKKIVQKSGFNDPEKFWGTYRPNNYFGLKTRDAFSPVMGLMWYFPYKLQPNGEGIRHWCKQDDRLHKYGWLQHDGTNFGIQEIHDGDHLLETSFIKFYTGKFGGDWTARISVKPKTNSSLNEEVSLIWYMALDEKTDGHIGATYNTVYGIEGETKGLGHFKLNLQNTSGSIIKQSFLSAVTPNLQFIRETVLSNLRLANDKVTMQKFIILAGDTTDEHTKPNMIAIQLNVKAPFTLDITFEGVSNGSFQDDLVPPPTGKDYTKLLAKKRSEFRHKFEEKFALKAKGYKEEQVLIAEAALSNMLGSLGYFYGSSRVQSVHTKVPVPYWKAPLYTAVPSRSFFPRGFLWDEGFHGLLISTWDIDIELDILSHWFDLMNIEGWIPREQILGVEALAKVPEEFVTQHNTNANPPTFFLVLKRLLEKYPEEMIKANRMHMLDKMYPRLQAWFSWFNNTQKGDILGTYRWRGRDDQSVKELNPKTLTSGLDDYPRASHPTNIERHVDLRCWIALAAGVMVELGNLLGKNTEKFEETYYYLTDNELLNEHHLAPKTQTYADYGLHTDSVTLKRPPPPPPNSPKNPQQTQDKIRVVFGNPEQKFVDSHFGYVSLFPFLLQITEEHSPNLGILLKKIKDPNLLWTKFGLRSLAKSAPLYMKRNTEHDPPYWRGQIWINLNFLALKSLHHYANLPNTPYADLAKEIYLELRQNVVTNILNQYNRTGYFWEQYNDETGEGSGCHPFTGWTALFVLIMSEQY